MVDGKVGNSVANVSSSLRCYLCHAISKNFNELDNISERPIISEGVIQEFIASCLYKNF